MSADAKFKSQHFEDQVRDSIIKTPSKSCELHHKPTRLLNNEFPLIAEITNKSLVESNIPVKKTSLDLEVQENYRPLSNLPFLLKIL